MPWFKNVIIYRLSKDLDWSDETLQQALQQYAFVPCLAGDRSRVGWKNPLQGSELLYFKVGKQILLEVYKEEKILPATVIKQECEQRINQAEQALERPLKKAEKQNLKDDVVATLLPRAFSKYQSTLIWIDSENQLIYVDAASSKRAEDSLALLRKSLGSLPVIPLAFANDPSCIMTDWIAQDSLPSWLEALDEAQLRGSQEESVIHCKKQSLEKDEILALLQAHKVVTKLALAWQDTLTFIFNEDCTLKRLKFADVIKDQNSDILKEDIAQRFDADFVLMTGILSQLTEKLVNAFGGEKVNF